MFVNFVVTNLFIGWKTLRDASAASLFIVLKDHDNPGLQHIQHRSQSSVVDEAVKKDGFNVGCVVVKESDRYSTRPAAVWILERMNERVATSVKEGLAKISHLLDILVVSPRSEGKHFWYCVFHSL